MCYLGAESSRLAKSSFASILAHMLMCIVKCLGRIPGISRLAQARNTPTSLIIEPSDHSAAQLTIVMVVVKIMPAKPTNMIRMSAAQDHRDSATPL